MHRARWVAAWLLAAASGCGVDGPDSDVESPLEAADRLAGWSCPGTTGKTKSPLGSYYVTSFGCWVDANGKPHADPGDNCIPACKGSAPAAYQKLCSSKSGPACERAVGWYAADADRFGCMARLRVTNPLNGKAAVVVVLDRGPHCKIEKKVKHWVLDLSYPATLHLFGEPKGAVEKAEVLVEEVAPSTPLGPVEELEPEPSSEPSPEPEPPPELAPLTVVVDSNNTLNPAGAHLDVSGAWKASSNVSGYHGTGYFWRATGASDDPARFELELAEPRTMAVEAWWTAAHDRSSQAPFRIYDAQGKLLATVHVDQRKSGGQWVPLGAHTLTTGKNRIELSRLAPKGSVVVADAVRFRDPP
jgi:hypothetical protein